jgi:SPP1 gp7 family putative phage head morphogenesis protein
MYRNPALFAATVANALTHDIAMSARSRRREQAHFQRIRNAAIQYAVQLRKIARHVGDLIKQFPPGSEAHVAQVNDLLVKYSNLIEPWANAAAERMIAEVSRRDETAWFRHAKEMSTLMKREMKNTPLGEIYRQLQQDQVHYIKSIPLDAAERVQKLTMEYVLSGKRYGGIIDEILNQTNVSLSKATLIARTETAKAQAVITQARAEYVGSPGYIWRTARDSRVRKAHKKLEGTPQKWNEPPIAEENGQRHHPGMFPNCRCYAEPIIPLD